MNTPVFYAPSEHWGNGLITLPAPEAHHAQDVLRLRSGALVTVVDGLGQAADGELLPAGGRKLTVRIHSIIRNFGEPYIKLTLAAGLSAGSKFDEVVEKGTEIGVCRFVPLITEKSKIRLDDAAKAKTKAARLEKVALAAIKQCRRSYRPDIALPTKFPQFVKETESSSLNLIFVPVDAAIPLSRLEVAGGVRRASLLVGPESGFSSDEVQLALAAGYRAVSLGPRILRTETAGPVCAALVMQRLGELS
jgi:16S rRNA (uracil1498-N3)-methyltransferase